SERQKDQKLLDLVKSQSGAGIIYVTLQQSAQRVAQFLMAQGIDASAYHAGLENDKRQAIQEKFMASQLNVVVATIAFGMGIDKSDIRFVMHYDLPKSIENYSQEIGRAGRDGLGAQCITLANLDGLNTVENFVYGDTPELSGIEYVLQDIRQHTQQAATSGANASDWQWEMQVNSLSNDSNIRQLPLKTLLVQLEIQGALRPKYAYFADFKYKFLQEKQHILNQFEGERQTFLAAIFAHSHMKKVWGSVDFDVLYQTYGADRARVVTALEYLQQNHHIELETKRITDVYQVDKDKLADTSLGQTLYSYFADKERKEIKRIAALVRFFELDSCLSHNLSRYFDDQQAPVQCGHCSVCRGDVASLEYSMAPAMPDELALKEAMAGLQERLGANSAYELTVETFCRFLTGMSVPLFARNKVRQLPGFGICAACRYADVRERLGLLM
ncbi:MAG: ATP-dependent DNA helicase RecQ, partial [Paraglaciecola sp.]